MTNLYVPKKIYLEKAAGDLAGARQILSRLPGVPVEEIDEVRPLIESLRRSTDPIGEGKRSLFLARDRGRAFKPFPNSEGLVSCNFYSLHLVEGCDLECSYCILQAYLTNPFLTVYVNTEEILEGLAAFLKENPDQTFRIGTGQLADSLSLDPLTAHTELLVPFFAKQRNAILELKTKSVNIDRLRKLDPKERTVVSWSMNTRRIQQEEEHKCASIEERIRAARQCIEWGYRIGFHFDPIIDYENCEAEYEESIEEIFSNVPPERIAWMSLGTLRFMPELKDVMADRFPKSPLPYAEWVRGFDGKLRYAKSRRLELYRPLIRKISNLAPRVPVYLCMETGDIWDQVFGETANPVKIRESLDRVVETSAQGNHKGCPY